MVSMAGIVQALKNFLVLGEDEEPGKEGKPYAAPKAELAHAQCMACGLDTTYAEMMYENGYAVCNICYKTSAEANYYGRVVWA